MIMFALQVVFFIAVAFGLGCLFGCWLRGRFGTHSGRSEAAAAVTHEGAAKTSSTGELAAPRPHYESETAVQRPSALSPETEESAEKQEPAAADRVEIASVPATKSTTKLTKPKTAKPKAEKPSTKAAVTRPPRAKAVGASPKARAEKQPLAKPKASKAGSLARDAPDNLKQIKGVGPAIEAKLNAAGINNFAQIAAWTKKEQATFGEQLSFSGRIEREDWVRQAKVLAKGGATEFSKRVAKGEVASSAGRKPKRDGKK